MAHVSLWSCIHLTQCVGKCLSFIAYNVLRRLPLYCCHLFGGNLRIKPKTLGSNGIILWKQVRKRNISDLFHIELSLGSKPKWMLICLLVVLKKYLESAKFLNLSHWELKRNTCHIADCSMFAVWLTHSFSDNSIFLRKYNNSIFAFFSWSVFGQILLYLTPFHNSRSRQPFS